MLSWHSPPKAALGIVTPRGAWRTPSCVMRATPGDSSRYIKYRYADAVLEGD